MSRATKVSCHCGSVELRVKLPDGPLDPHRCDCSFCRRRAAPTVSVPLNDLEVVRGGDMLSLYTWNTGTAQHYFCSKCGIYTHHQRRSHPDEYGVNLGCLEGVNPAEFEPIEWVDGVNHPSDA